MELGIVQSNSAFCWAVISAIPGGVTRLNVHFVLAPFSILAGTGSQVPLTVPLSSISTEELDTMTLALDVMTLAEERFTMGEEELSSGGKTDAEDKQLETELLNDEKELAEHNMLVDLGRNDLGKISRFGTVQVEKLHSIERYSHVMHIGSTVRGEIRDEFDALDAVSAVLPAGTLSGAPKIRACQLIAELENNKRGIYGGAIGYIDFTGNLDTCIAIRIAYKKNGRVFVRSGAGIVADSVPEKEYQECINKAAAVVSALKMAEEADE